MTKVTRKIGDAEVSALGYGAMGLSVWYGAVGSDEERLKFLDGVYERGCNFWDTADAYGDSEELIGKWFKRTGKRNEIFLATKFGFSSPSGKFIDGDPDYARAAFEKSIKRLGVDQIDLWYLHRADTEVPIEKTIGAMAEFVKAGRVKYLGISECSETTLRRAHAVHPITALQVEYSIFTLDIEDPKIGLLKAARELGIKIVAYSPLGRGLLTGQFKSPDDFPADDFRRIVPRYSAANFPNILKLVDGLKEVGAKHGATAGQVALAWVLAQGDDVIPIPGTKKEKYLEENLGALKLQLSSQEVQAVRDAAQKANAEQGDRYPAIFLKSLLADTPPL